MAKPVVLEAKVRKRGGKGAARAIRREGRVPAVIYGDKQDPITVSFGYQDLMKHVQTGRFLSTLVDIQVDGDSVRAIARDIQFEPVRDFLQHVDFLRLGKGARIVVEVAVNFLNEEICPGLKTGGALNVVRYEIEMECRASEIPDSIDIDLAELDMGDSVHGSDLSLPEGATLAITDRDFTICTIAAPSGGASGDEEGEEGEEVEGEETEGEAAEGEEGGDAQE
jgi:large subunit ribosomal protein L25